MDTRFQISRTSYSANLEPRSYLCRKPSLCSTEDDVDELLGCRHRRNLRCVSHLEEDGYSHTDLFPSGLHLGDGWLCRRTGNLVVLSEPNERFQKKKAPAVYKNLMRQLSRRNLGICHGLKSPHLSFDCTLSTISTEEVLLPAR